MNTKKVTVTSGYGANTRIPYVEIQIGDARTQLTPLKAREIAQMLLEAAEAAESDGFIFEFMQGTAELDAQQAAQIIMQYRTWRKEQRQKQIAHEYPRGESA